MAGNEENGLNGQYRRVKAAANAFMNLVTVPSENRGRRRAKMPEQMSPDELESSRTAYDAFMTELESYLERGGEVEKKRMDMYETLMGLGEKLSEYAVVEAELVDEEYDVSSELAYAEKEDDGAVSDADELEVRSNGNDAAGPSAGDWAGRMRARIDAACTALDARYGALTERMENVLDDYKDAGRSLAEHAKDLHESMITVGANERDMLQFEADTINADVESACRATDILLGKSQE